MQKGLDINMKYFIITLSQSLLTEEEAFMKKLQAQICAALMTSSIALGALPSAQVFAANSDIDGHWVQQQIF